MYEGTGSRFSTSLGGNDAGAFLAEIVVVEQLEARALHRLFIDISQIRIFLEYGRSPAVHVHHDLHVGVELDVL